MFCVFCSVSMMVSYILYPKNAKKSAHKLVTIFVVEGLIEFSSPGSNPLQEITQVAMVIFIIFLAQCVFLYCILRSLHIKIVIQNQ